MTLMRLRHIWQRNCRKRKRLKRQKHRCNHLCFGKHGKMICYCFSMQHAWKSPRHQVKHRINEVIIIKMDGANVKMVKNASILSPVNQSSGLLPSPKLSESVGISTAHAACGKSNKARSRSLIIGCLFHGFDSDVRSCGDQRLPLRQTSILSGRCSGSRWL